MGRIGTFALLSSALAAACATAMPLAASERTSPSAERQRHATVRPAVLEETSVSGTSARILKAHNAERARLKLPGLSWNQHLEREAREWAEHLSRRGTIYHADDRTRNGTGENLWMGTSGGWEVEGMVGMFLDERRHYRHARFPDVSRTGNWADVGHYTQIVWRDTREVGCAVASARGNDVLVCRYYPAGNVMGRKAF